MYTDSDDDVPEQRHSSIKPPVLKDEELPSLFWDTMPENAEDNPDFAALQALRDECTPEERAETCKVNGNNKLSVGLKAKNKILLREAVDFYSQGLGEKCNDSRLNAVLYSNRAHVESLLGNWRKALDDAMSAMKLDDSNIKAHFRAARAAVKLRKWQQCLDLCGKGRQLDKQAKEFDSLEKEAAAGIKAEEAAAEEARRKEEERLAPVKKLSDAIARRGYQITLPQVRAQQSWRPALESDPDSGAVSLTWPCIILYPEGATQDEIQAWHEADTVKDHLDQMFGPDVPPVPFDDEHHYTRDRVELYYLSHAGEPLTQTQLVQALATGTWPEAAAVGQSKKSPKRQPRWQRIKEHWTLHELLSQKDFVIPGLPLLAAVARGNDYYSRFLAQNKA